MSRVAINANVRERVPVSKRAAFSEAIKTARRKVYPSMEEFCEEYGTSVPTVYDRLNDPDHFSVGELRQLRHTLGMGKHEFMALLRPLL